jgi:hypothetical protein
MAYQITSPLRRAAEIELGHLGVLALVAVASMVEHRWILSFMRRGARGRSWFGHLDRADVGTLADVAACEPELARGHEDLRRVRVQMPMIRLMDRFSWSARLCVQVRRSRDAAPAAATPVSPAAIVALRVRYGASERGGRGVDGQLRVETKGPSENNMHYAPSCVIGRRVLRLILVGPHFTLFSDGP